MEGVSILEVHIRPQIQYVEIGMIEGQEHKEASSIGFMNQAVGVIINMGSIKKRKRIGGDPKDEPMPKMMSRGSCLTCSAVFCVPSDRLASKWHGLGRWDLMGNTNDTFSCM